MFHIRCHVCGESKWVMPILLTRVQVWRNLSQASSLTLRKHTLVRLQAWCETEFWTMKTNLVLERQSNFKHMGWERPRFSPGFISLCFIRELKLTRIKMEGIWWAASEQKYGQWVGVDSWKTVEREGETSRIACKISGNPFFRGNMMLFISLYLVKTNMSTVDLCLLKIIWKTTKLRMTFN